MAIPKTGKITAENLKTSGLTFGTPVPEVEPTKEIVPIDETLQRDDGAIPSSALETVEEFKSFLNTEGIASSSFNDNFEQLQDIRRQERERERLALEAIRAPFSAERTRIQEEGLAREGGILATGTITGGAGQSGLGFSSVRMAKRELVRQTVDKGLATLTKLETAAIAEQKIETTDRIREQIDASIQKSFD